MKYRKTKKYLRRRVQPVSKFDPKSFRVKDVGRPGKTKIIVGCPKRKYKKGRCVVGMQTQAILKERK